MTDKSDQLRKLVFLPSVSMELPEKMILQNKRYCPENNQEFNLDLKWEFTNTPASSLARETSSPVKLIYDINVSGQHITCLTVLKVHSPVRKEYHYPTAKLISGKKHKNNREITGQTINNKT